nr:unnamed protein product [Digitaria exilis]
MTSSSGASSSSKVLMTTADACDMPAVSWMKKLSMTSSGRAGDPVDDGVVEVAVGELGRVAERDEAAVDEVAVVVVGDEAARAGRPERGAAEAEVTRGAEREGHGAVGDDAGDTWPVGVSVEGGEEVLEAGEAGGHGGVAEGGDVLGGVGVGAGEAVVDGGEAEARRAVERVGPPRAEVAAVVELVVDEGDVEATGVEELGELQHRRDVALRWVWDHHRVRRRRLALRRWQRPHDD